MTPSQHWQQLVCQTMSRRNCSYGEASHITAKANPDAATLMNGFGASRSTVQFFNDKLTAPARMQARKKFAELVDEKVKAGHSYAAAHKLVTQKNPELLTEGAPQFVNVVLPGKAIAAPVGAQFVNVTNGSTPPTSSPMLKKLLWLPENASEEAFQTAFAGNGSKLSPQHPAKIFAGLVDMAQKKSGNDYDSCIQTTKTTFPQLWTACESLAAEPAQI